MKAVPGIERLFLLLVPLMWICSGQEPVLVECTRFNFRATAKRALFRRTFLQPDELTLGTGCPATSVQSDEIDFNYPVYSCGIQQATYKDGTIFHSWLTYVPRHGSITAELPLECVVPSTYFPPDACQMNSYFTPKPFPQQWFLVLYRVFRGYGERPLRDNWSTPYYGP